MKPVSLSLYITSSYLHKKDAAGRGVQVAHTYTRSDGAMVTWRLVYPGSAGIACGSLAAMLPPLLYAYHHLAGCPGRHKVIVPCVVPDDLKQLVEEIWADRYASEAQYRAAMNHPSQVSIQGGKRPVLKRLPMEIAQRPAVSFSFGKESVLSRRILLEAEMRPLLFTYTRQMEDVWTCEETPMYPVVTDFHRTLQKRGWWVTQFTPMLFAPMIESLNVGSLHMGNEYEDALAPEVWGYAYPPTYQQSPLYERYASRLLTLACERDVACYSLVRPMTEARALATLFRRYPEDWQTLVRSCWDASYSPHAVPTWCGRCPKCYRISELFAQVGIPCPFQVLLSHPPKDASQSLYDSSPESVEFDRRLAAIGTAAQPQMLNGIRDPRLRAVVEKLLTLPV
jgi:hypothetical protein